MRLTYLAHVRFLAIVMSAIACSAVTASCGGGGAGGSSLRAVPDAASLTPTPAPVNAGLDAMVASMDTSTLAAQGAAIAAYAQHYEIHTIFLGLTYTDYHTRLPGKDPATVTALNELFAVASVYIITGNSKWQLTPTAVPAPLHDILNVARMYGKFKGIIYDLEPQGLPQWQADRQAVITQYVDFLKFLFVEPGGYAYKATFISVAPYYEYNANSLGTMSPSLLEEVESLPGIAGTYMLDYYAPPAAQMNQAAERALGEMKKPFWWGSTTNAGDQPGISYHGTPAQTFIADMRTLRALVLEKNPHLIGLFDNAWNSQSTSLQTVLPPP